MVAVVNVWQCETCKNTHNARCSIWNCPGCEKEVCDSCFDRYMHCKSCSSGISDGELAKAAEMEE